MPLTTHVGYQAIIRTYRGFNTPVSMGAPLLARFGDIGILTPKRATTARIAASAPLRAAYSPFNKQITQLHQ